MTRRAFLIALTLLLMPKKVKANGSSLKGFCANSSDPVHVNLFSPAWINIELGSWSGNLENDYGATKFALNISSLSDMAIAEYLPPARAHPAYDHLLILLNEPDLTGQTAAQQAAIANHQMEIVLALDPQAKFALSVGTGEHPPYKEFSYGIALFGGITLKKKIVALLATYYPYQSAPLFQKFCNKFVEWAHTQNREAWLGEWGTITNTPPTVNVDVGVPFTLSNVRNAIDTAMIDRDSRYALMARTNTPAARYDCLLDANGVPTGEPF